MLLLATAGVGAAIIGLTGCQNSGGGSFAANDEALYLFDDGTSDIPQRSDYEYESPEPAATSVASTAPSPSSQSGYSAPAAPQYAANDTQYYEPDPEPARPQVRRAAVSSPPAASSGSTGSYTVRRGDTLYDIARAHGMSVSRLKSLNGLSSNLIHPGQRLSVSGSSRSSSSNTAVASSRGSGGSYTVRGGDTLWKISRRHGVSVSALKNANGLSSDIIQPGQRLSIP